MLGISHKIVGINILVKILLIMIKWFNFGRHSIRQVVMPQEPVKVDMAVDISPHMESVVRHFAIIGLCFIFMLFVAVIVIFRFPCHMKKTASGDNNQRINKENTV